MSNQISTAVNTQSPDLSNTQQDPNKYFNNFFAKDFSIGPANDVIVAYFEKYTNNAESGRALAGAVIYTAQAQNMDPMAVFSEFQKMRPNELNNYEYFHFFIQQWDQLVDNDLNINFNFIGKFENLNEAWRLRCFEVC